MNCLIGIERAPTKVPVKPRPSTEEASRKTQGSYTGVTITRNKVLKYYLQDDLYIFAKEYIFLRLIERFNIGLKITHLQFAPNYFCPQIGLIKHDGDLAGLRREIALKPIGYKLELAYKIILGLKNIHNLGIIHRDIKSKNILVNVDLCEATICDFNVSTIGDEVERRMSTCVQTPTFRAPEVIRGAKTCKYSNKIDIWGLGLALFELFFYGPPYDYRGLAGGPQNTSPPNKNALPCSTLPAMLIYDMKTGLSELSIKNKLKILNMLPISHLKKCLADKTRDFAPIYGPDKYANIINILAHCMDPNPGRRWDIFNLRSHFYMFLINDQGALADMGEPLQNQLSESTNMYNYYLDNKGYLGRIMESHGTRAFDCQNTRRFGAYLHILAGREKVPQDVQNLTGRLHYGLLARQMVQPAQYFGAPKAGLQDKIYTLALIYISCAILDAPVPEFIDISSGIIELQVKKILVECDGRLLEVG